MIRAGPDFQQLRLQMLFNSYPFLLVFLPAALLVCRIADPYPRYRTWTMIALSMLFYSYWNPSFVTLLIGSILVNWLVAQAYAATRRGAIIVAAIVANLAVLGIFKYSGLFADTLASILGVSVGPVELALPLGISFFTFHHIMYLVDLKRGRAPVFPLDRYALYICFFPQAIAGPLARWSEVMHQFGARIFTLGWERRFAVGVTFIIIGLIEKLMLGDALGRVVDPIFERARSGPLMDGTAWFGAAAFAFQVFFDFAGYSDIAIGLALMLGVELPRNFNAPFRAMSIQDFWQRWHMTLTRFLRDYVFVPLSNLGIGGNAWRAQRQFCAILVTMALCGLWHGAGWTFVLWGAVHGLALAFVAIWRRHLPSPPWLLGWAATVGFFILTAPLFRAGSFEVARHIYEGLFVAPLVRGIEGGRTLAAAAFCAILLPPSHELVRRLTGRARPAVAALLGLAGVAILVKLGSERYNEFIYFQF